MATRPRPGTIAYGNPEPAVITEIRQLVSGGSGKRQAVSKIAERNPDRHHLEEAHNYWVQQMPGFHWENHEGTAVLMILEAILAETPRGN